MSKEAEKFAEDVEESTSPGVSGIEDTPEPHEKMGHHVEKFGGLLDRLETIISNASDVSNDVVDAEHVVTQDVSPVEDKGPWLHRGIL